MIGGHLLTANSCLSQAERRHDGQGS